MNKTEDRICLHGGREEDNGRIKWRDEGGQKLFLFRNLYHVMVPVYALLISVDRRSVVLTCSFSRQLEDKKHKQQNVKEMSSWEVMKTLVGMSYHEESTEAEKPLLALTWNACDLMTQRRGWSSDSPTVVLCN